jgi:hypothetical protein
MPRAVSGPVDHQRATSRGMPIGVRGLPAEMVTAGELESVNTVEEIFDVFLPDRAGVQASGFQALRTYREEHQQRRQERHEDGQPRDHSH